MSKQLDRIFETYAYNSQQKLQLRMADDKGLDIDYLKNPLYDWEQMHEIALALEANIDPTPFCDPSIPSESMREIRNHLFDNMEIYEARREEVAEKRLKNIFVFIGAMLLIFLIAVIGFLRKDFISSVFSELKLTLVDEKVDIGISELSSFRYTDLVQQSSGGELIIPNLDISSPGEYNLEYSIKNEAKEIKKSMIIYVYDDIKPIIELKTNILTTKINKSKPNYNSYIKNAYDNYDKNLSITDVLIDDSKVDYKKAGKYSVTFNLKDSSENIAIEKLTVLIEKENIDLSSDISSGDNSNNNSNSSSNNTVNKNNHDKNNDKLSANNNQSSTTNQNSNKDYDLSYMPENKVFLVSDYESFDECINQCKIYIDSCINKGFVGTAKYEPIKENDVYIGYKVLFTK